MRDVPGDVFWPLPGGAGRRVGVEVEFAGLSAPAAAACVAACWGGEVAETAPQVREVAGGRFGPVTVELDTALKAGVTSQIGQSLLEAARAVVPVEIVTAPLPEAALPEVARLIAALEEAGAEGSRSGPMRAFGLHLNPEVAGPDAETIVPVVRAWGLMEDALRAGDPVDATRRVTPFVDPWPRGFVDRLADEAAGWGLDALTDACLAEVGSRNHGLDLLPLLAHLRPETVRAALPDANGGRPAWHVRLPEAGLGRPDWSFAWEWNRWVLVERAARAPGLVDALGAAWRDHRGDPLTLRGAWAPRAAGLMAQADIWGAA